MKGNCISRERLNTGKVCEWYSVNVPVCQRTVRCDQLNGERDKEIYWNPMKKEQKL